MHGCGSIANVHEVTALTPNEKGKTKPQRVNEFSSFTVGQAIWSDTKNSNFFRKIRTAHSSNLHRVKHINISNDLTKLSVQCSSLKVHAQYSSIVIEEDGGVSLNLQFSSRAPATLHFLNFFSSQLATLSESRSKCDNDWMLLGVKLYTTLYLYKLRSLRSLRAQFLLTIIVISQHLKARVMECQMDNLCRIWND